MAGRFEQWITKLRLPWMDDKAKAILGGHASIVGDRTLAYASQANSEHLPLLAKDPISVGLIASERQIEPGPTETQAALSARLVAAVSQWQLAGSPIGLLLALYYAEFPGAFLVQQNGVAYALSGTPDLDDLASLTTQPPWYAVTDVQGNPWIAASTDGRPAIATDAVPWWTFSASSLDAQGNQFCSRFAVVFPDGLAADLTDPATLARIWRCINKWRPAKALCTEIAVGGACEMWDWPMGQWDTGALWGDGTIAHYYP